MIYSIKRFSDPYVDRKDMTLMDHTKAALTGQRKLKDPTKKPSWKERAKEGAKNAWLYG